MFNIGNLDELDSKLTCTPIYIMDVGGLFYQDRVTNIEYRIRNTNRVTYTSAGPLSIYYVSLGIGREIAYILVNDKEVVVGYAGEIEIAWGLYGGVSRSEQINRCPTEDQMAARYYELRTEAARRQYLLALRREGCT